MVNTDTSRETMERQEESIFVGLTYDHLDVVSIINRVKSPKAGAVVLFAGTTRDTFGDQLVKQLQYSAYVPLALNSLLRIAREMKTKHSLTAISMIHRLGVVPIGEESILIAVSSPHRQAAWRAGEEALELCKEKVEVWKLEEFGGDQSGVWRANRDGQRGVKVQGEEENAEYSKTAGDAYDTHEEGNSVVPEQGPHGPILRRKMLGERGHGPVVQYHHET